VELFNRGPEPVNIAGWALEDNAAADTLPELTIDPGGFAILAASDSFSAAYPDYVGPLAIVPGHLGNSLGNDGDRLILRDASNAVIDAVSWGVDVSALEPAVADVAAGHSVERAPAGYDTDSAADFIDNDVPSPGVGLESPSGGKPDPQGQPSGSIDVLRSSDEALPGWAPWAIAGASAVALAGMAAWRALPILRARFGKAA